MLYTLLTEVSISATRKMRGGREKLLSSHFSCSVRDTSVSRVIAVIHVDTFINHLLCQIQRQIAEGYSVIWNCKAVDELCFCMEDIFNHGLKERWVGMSHSENKDQSA